MAIAAAERHLKDLRDGKARGLYFDEAQAARALRFFPAVLPITAGAMAEKPFVPLPWHSFVIGSLFGWRTASGRMRFRSAWIETGKGQAKSPLMAAIGLYMMGFYGIPRSEVYSIGQDRRTANVLFEDAVSMCRAPTPGYDDGRSLASGDKGVLIRGEGNNAWKIEHPSSGSKFQALANGEAVSGPRPAAVLADEIHEFKNNTSIETWARAIAKMPGDALMILGTNTPSAVQIVGTDYSERYQRIAKGEVRDDEAFSYIARVDRSDWDNVFDNEACWTKALPALGITFPVENIRGQVNSAREFFSTAMSVKRLYFGIPIGVSDFWIDEPAWESVQAEITDDQIEQLKSCQCWLSLDLSTKNDLTALSCCWRDDEDHLWVKTWYWTTQEGLADRSRRDNAPYDQWVDDGLIEAVPGPVIDKTFVAAVVSELVAKFNVQFLAFDAAHMADFIAACDDVGLATWKYDGANKPQGTGLKMVSHAQGKKVRFEDRQLTMPRSIERLEDAILAGKVTIDASTVTNICASNAHLDVDGLGNRAFIKRRSRGRIDGIVTIAMAVGSAMNEMADAPSVSFWEVSGAI